jgi:hypothetical protein
MLTFTGFPLLVAGIVFLALGVGTAWVHRRYATAALGSVPALRGVAPGRPVALFGAINVPPSEGLGGIVMSRGGYRVKKVWVGARVTGGRFGSNGAGGPHYEERKIPDPPLTRPFRLVTPEGDVRILNRGYDFRRAELPSVASHRSELSEGFGSGDEVLILGRTARGGIVARLVFGGTLEEYLAEVKKLRDSYLRSGYRLTVPAALMLLGWALMRAPGRWSRRQAG